MRGIADILSEYTELPEFYGMHLDSVNQRGHTGDSPLHVAIHRRDVEEVDCLLAAGADTNARGELGYTPLHIAVSNDIPAIVTRLLKAGARQDIANDDGIKPRQLAASLEVRELLEAMAATNRK